MGSVVDLGLVRDVTQYLNENSMEIAGYNQ